MATKLGAPWNASLLSSDTKPLQYYLSAVEELGYDYISMGDHVLGADRSVRPDWKPYFGRPPLFDYKDVHHEAFTSFAFIAALTKKIHFSIGILIVGQRQTALMAKQAAEVDYLSGGRMRIVAAVGWNDVEYESLGVDFHTRGARVEEQIKLMRLFWTQEVVTFHGKFHTINAAGIKPMPVQRPIPIWVGGSSEAVLKRTGRLGDGWHPSYPYFNERKLKEHIALFQQSAKEAGRDPKKIQIQGMTFFRDVRFEMEPGDKLPPKNIEEGVEEAHAWKKLGATHYSVSALGTDLPTSASLQEANARRGLGDKAYSGAVNYATFNVDTQLDRLRKFKEMLGKDF